MVGQAPHAFLLRGKYMHILLVNDDGIDSPGLDALRREAVKRGHQVTICAPAHQQSAVSQALTFFRPISVTPVARDGAAAYAIDGTPADCVRLGLCNLAQDKVDLVISGINDGLNSGTAIYCSGTVGAAREAALLRSKSMAVSLDRPADTQMLSHLAEFALQMGERLKEYPAPLGSVLNINAPALPAEDLLPPVMAPVNHSLFTNSYEQRVSPRGEMYFWVMKEFRHDPPTIGSDEDFLQKGHVTCTFLLHPGESYESCLDFLQER
jgi:5'-nucleotidase